MVTLLKLGQVLDCESGGSCTVSEFLGGGGQGEVYKAKWDDHDYALKWYFSHVATPEQKQTLENLITDHRAPTRHFLWPLSIVHNAKVPGFGYLMKLRESRFNSLLDLMTQKVDPKYRELVTAGINLAENFFQLHAAGLCYRDISFGNVFFDHLTGEVQVCDNDNVTENRSSQSGILGTPDFMAPEIVRGEALPDRNTDLYSLSVLLFFMFCTSHPLAGRKILQIRCWDLPARKKLYGSEPLFIFDPRDQTNQAVSLIDDPSGEAGGHALTAWPIFPQFLKDKFTEAFTDGLSKPDERVLDSTWRTVLSRLRDSIITCAHCGRESFFDTDSSPPVTCPYDDCNCPLKLPMRLRLPRTTVMLEEHAKLHPHHVEGNSVPDFSIVSAEIVPHPTNPHVRGLRNNTTETWTITTTDGTVRDVPPGRSVPLAAGTKIKFPSIDAEFEH
jgi:serine/threonine protein kinase